MSELFTGKVEVKKVPPMPILQLGWMLEEGTLG
jgi:hypothetical protein